MHLWRHYVTLVSVTLDLFVHNIIFHHSLRHTLISSEIQQLQQFLLLLALFKTFVCVYIYIFLFVYVCFFYVYYCRYAKKHKIKVKIKKRTT